MFEQATRMKFRFPSCKGELSVEQLWDVPLRSRDDFNLNNIARGISRELEASKEENFVDVAKTNPTKDLLQSKFNVVKRVIDVKLDEEKEREKEADRKKELGVLLQALAEKKQGELSDLSVKELEKRIKALQ